MPSLIFSSVDNSSIVAPDVDVLLTALNAHDKRADEVLTPEDEALLRTGGTPPAEYTREELLELHHSREFHEVLNATLLYNSPEHRLLGDSVQIDGYDMGSLRYRTEGGHTLSYGEALALCGDWYGGSSPITDAFKVGNTRDARSAAARNFLTQDWACMDGDKNDPKRWFGYSGDEVRAVIGSFGSRLVDDLTGNSPSHKCTSFGLLAFRNADHFQALQSVSFTQQGGAGAWEAYSAGHSVACMAARQPGEAALQRALVQNACASHFLSDMFAPGHHTQSRRAFMNYANSFSGPSRVFKNFYSKWMHDEANQAGMTFENTRGDRWVGYGDGCDKFERNRANKAKQMEALQASAQAIYNVWRAHQPPAAAGASDEAAQHSSEESDETDETDEIDESGAVRSAFARMRRMRRLFSRARRPPPPSPSPPPPPSPSPRPAKTTALSPADHVTKCLGDETVASIIPITSKLQDSTHQRAAGNLSPMFTSSDGRTIQMRGHDKCSWYKMNYDEFCDAQQWRWKGVDARDPCSNWLTKNTFAWYQKSDPCGPVSKRSSHNHHNVPGWTSGRVCNPDKVAAGPN